MSVAVLRWLVATVHLLALPLGLAGVWGRARGLGRELDSDGLRRVFAADNAWGIAALLWIGTGLWRLLGGLEKGAAYYLGSSAFHAKMGLLGAILLLEIFPMVTLIQWRTRARRGWSVEPGRARVIRLISMIQAGLTVLMVLAAAAMARGMEL